MHQICIIFCCLGIEIDRMTSILRGIPCKVMDDTNLIIPHHRTKSAALQSYVAQKCDWQPLIRGIIVVKDYTRATRLTRSRSQQILFVIYVSYNRYTPCNCNHIKRNIFYSGSAIFMPNPKFWREWAIQANTIYQAHRTKLNSQKTHKCEQKVMQKQLKIIPRSKHTIPRTLPAKSTHIIN